MIAATASSDLSIRSWAVCQAKYMLGNKTDVDPAHLDIVAWWKTQIISKQLPCLGRLVGGGRMV